MVLALDDGWYVLDAYNARPADYLHLVNDSQPRDRSPEHADRGRRLLSYVVDGFVVIVDEFDFSKTDVENEAAEFLVWYSTQLLPARPAAALRCGARGARKARAKARGTHPHSQHTVT